MPKIYSDAEVSAREAQLVTNRLVELREKSIKGSFDIAHLKEINRYIFQDFPKQNIPELKHYTPGEFRQENQLKDYDWIKKRTLKTVDKSFVVAYADFNEKDKQSLESLLIKKADSKKLKELSLQDFTKELANLYSELDYLHPFNDGNSRTLREFTRELAEKSGYELRWEKLNESPKQHDALCIARDLETTKKALPNMKHREAMQHVAIYHDSVQGNKKLHEILKDIITPKKAKS